MKTWVNGELLDATKMNTLEQSIPASATSSNGVVTFKNGNGTDLFSVAVGTWNYLGANPVKVMDIAETETPLSATGFNTWTPSTTATTIVNSSDVGTLALDTLNYDYVLLWFFDVTVLYNGTETNTAKLLRSLQILRSEVIKRPSGLSKLIINEYNANSNAAYNNAGYGLIAYYDTSSAQKISYTNAGLFSHFAASTFSDTTSDTPTLTVKTPSIRAQCSSTFFSTANAGKVDKENTKIKLRGEIWRIDKRGVMAEIYKNIVDMYNT